MSVEFHDFRVRVQDALNDKAIAYLHEAAGLIEGQTKRNMPRGHWFAQIKNAWRYHVDEDKLEATIGNPLEPSLWTEFGTGEHSISPKGGRKGYWVYVKEPDSNISGGYTYSGGKEYSLQDAKRIVAMMRADGLDARYTKGQTPKRPFYKAYKFLKSSLIRRAEQVMKGMNE